MKKRENILILHDIRSAENVGSMFRTADAAGMAKIYLSGFTPAPIDRFGRKRSDIAKSALGAEGFVLWEEIEINSLLKQLKKDNFQIVAIEQDKNSTDYRKVKLEAKNAFIVGAEVTGIPKNILKKCDVIAEIPMKGKKESLNVSVALGVALFRIISGS
jgi:23S rRNA (guanosine2251-2'-O)-methyltransferase